MKRIAVLIMLLSSPIWADVVVLKDGTRLEGELKRTPEGWIMTLPDGKTRSFGTDAVQSLQPGAAVTRAPVMSATELASLRRSVEALSDLNQIIERYQRFIDSAKDASLIAEAKREQDVWRERKAQGLVKHGTRWVTPSQVTDLAIEATARALEARDLIRQNRARDAEPILQEALTIDPKNSAAQFLRGVVLYRQDRLVDARRAFDAVLAAIPDHAPSLNNIAVILGRQNQLGGALNFYDQAMLAAGINDFILSNVAEVLGSMPEDQRRGTPYQRAMRRFAEQDQALQQVMSQRGMYRWGATWVDEKKMDELKAAEQQIKQKLDAIQKEFDEGSARMNAIAGEISSNENTMQGLRVNTAFRDGSGNVVVMGPPPAYYEFQQRNVALNSEAEQLRTKLGRLSEQSQRTRGELPVPRFTGVQQIVGVEGMPGASPEPSTQPAR